MMMEGITYIILRLKSWLRKICLCVCLFHLLSYLVLFKSRTVFLSLNTTQLSRLILGPVFHHKDHVQSKNILFCFFSFLFTIYNFNVQYNVIQKWFLIYNINVEKKLNNKDTERRAYTILILNATENELFCFLWVQENQHLDKCLGCFFEHRRLE